MVVREQHRVDPVDAIGDQLHPHLGRLVDQDTCAPIGLDHGSNARSTVPGIGRPAHRAVAPDHRHAKTGPRAEKRELHTVSTFSRLVVPGTSNGTPAVTSTRSPGRASPSSTAACRASATISSYVVQWATRCGTTPQTSASCRYVCGMSVSARIGTLGRCDETTRALNPPLVNTTTSGVASIRCAAIVAAAIASSVATDD